MNSHGFTTPQVVIFILALAVVVGGYFAFGPKTPAPVAQPQAQTSTSTPDGTADWKTYRNEQYGFEVKYPSNFELKQDYGETRLSHTESPIDASHIAHTIDVYMYAGIKLSAPNLECGGRCGYENFISASEKDGDWNKDYIFDYGGMGSWDVVVNAYQKRGQNYYIFSLYSSDFGSLGVPGGNGYGKPTKEELVAPKLKNLQDKNNSDIRIFNQILSTFKFTPPNVLTQKIAEDLVKNNWLWCEGMNVNCLKTEVNIENREGIWYVTSISSGLGDDSVIAEKRIAKAVFENGAWSLDKPTVTFRCATNRGHQDFSTENCH